MVDSVHHYRTASLPSELARAYWAWLDRSLGPLVKVSTVEGTVSIELLGVRAITLEACTEGSFEVRGGALAREGGRFVFERSGEGVEVALLGFRPRLPLWLYRLSHGPVHEWTMRRFGRHLADKPALDGAVSPGTRT